MLQLACEKKIEVISLANARNEKESVIQMRSSLVAYIHRQRNRIPCAHDVTWSILRAELGVAGRAGGAGETSFDISKL